MKYLIILFAIIPHYIQAQACCSAGVPIAGNLDLTVVNARLWSVALSYEYNYLDDVIAGSEEIEGFRSGLSKSALLSISHGFNKRFSFTGLFSYVQQTRLIKNTNRRNSTSGPGDASLFVKYNILSPDIISQRQLAIGIGLKFPTGSSNITNGDVLLAADLQPGSGSWDTVFWGYYSQGFLPTRFSYFMSSSYRLNGANERYQNSRYTFGDELLINSGAIYSTKNLFNYILQLRYRFTKADQLGTLTVPNTSGTWLYLLPGVNINYKPFTLRLHAQLPVYRKLKGIQLTTTYKTGLTLTYNLYPN